MKRTNLSSPPSPRPTKPPGTDSTPSLILVIGYGNDLRGDDAVGPRVAAAVAASSWPGVKTMAVQQLTPELSEPLSVARAAIFVDAAHESQEGEVKLARLEPDAQAKMAGHLGHPEAVLALAKAAFGRSPPAWLVTIPCTNFDFGTGLSPAAEQGMRAAIERVRELICELN